MSNKSKEVRELIALVEEAGWRVVDKGSNYQAYSPNGRAIVTLHKTPSARNWRRRAERDFRQAGLDVRALSQLKAKKGKGGAA
jgi:predicted RNA binding protein YcfA (HicA-like mRNA interferase family)